MLDKKTDRLTYFQFQKCITMLYMNISECIEIVVYGFPLPKGYRVIEC